MTVEDVHFNILQLAKEGQIPGECAIKVAELMKEEFQKEDQMYSEDLEEMVYRLNEEILEDFQEELDPDYDKIIDKIDCKVKVEPYTSIYDMSKVDLEEESESEYKRELYMENFIDGNSDLGNIPLTNVTRRFLIKMENEQNYTSCKKISVTLNETKPETEKTLSRSSTNDTIKSNEYKEHKNEFKPVRPEKIKEREPEISAHNDIKSNSSDEDGKKNRSRNWNKFLVEEKKPEFKSGLDVLNKRIKEGNAKPIENLDLERKTSNYGSMPSNHSLGLPPVQNPYARYNLGNYGNYRANQGVMNKKEGPQLDPKYLPLVTGDVTPEIISMVIDMKVMECEKIKKDDIVGLEEVKKVIIDKIVNPILMPSLHIGLFKAPKGILLFGPPGTGKTTIAKWIANVSKAAFFEISPSSITSKFYGESESIIKTLFKVALVESPSLIFIDEVDAILGMRKATDDDSSVRMKNQLLQMMDGINSGSMSRDKDTGREKVVIVVGATNRPHMIDSAALRRFTKRILIPPPDHETRKKFIVDIINKRSSKPCVLSQEDLEKIAVATEGWTGCDLLTLCFKAGEYCYDDTVNLYGGIENIKDFKDFRGVEMADIEKALECTRPSNDESMEFFLNWSAKHGSV